MAKVSLSFLLTGWLLLVSSQPVHAWETIHLPPRDFLAEFVPGCEKKALWLTDEVKSRVEQLVERPFPGVRVRYCIAGERTGWILDEIGKTEPITTGVVINGGRVERVRVLVFRESRGGEVHREAFVRQYESAQLDGDGSLDRSIDGITGATLSVYALGRQVKLALYLDAVARQPATMVSP
jgi:hypothetical protein